MFFFDEVLKPVYSIDSSGFIELLAGYTRGSEIVVPDERASA